MSYGMSLGAAEGFQRPVSYVRVRSRVHDVIGVTRDDL